MKRILIAGAAVLIMMTALIIPAVGLAAANIWLGGEQLEVGKYLLSNSSTLTDQKPEDNYAYLSYDAANGHTLTLHNYTYSGIGSSPSPHYPLLVTKVPLTIQLDEGTANRLTNTASSWVGGTGTCIKLDGRNVHLTITGSGSLTLESAYYSISALLSGNDRTGTSSVIIEDGDITLKGKGAGIALGYANSSFSLGKNAKLNIDTTKTAIRADGGVSINGGTLNIANASSGIETSTLMNISDGTITMNNVGDGIDVSSSGITISGGTVDITGRGYGIVAGGLATIKGGTIKIDNSAGTQHAIAGYGVDITGGVLDLTSRLSAVRSYYTPITCTLGLPGGAAIIPENISPNRTDYYLDYTASYESKSRVKRTIHLPCVTAAPAAPVAPADVPSTGDSAPLAAWFALAALSAACGAWLIRKRVL